MNRKYQFNLLLAFFVFVHISNGQQATTRKYAIRNVKVIPMSKEISLPEQAVLIENGIIKKIRSTASIRTGNGITVIEGSAKYLLPGLFDMHTHFSYEQGEHKNTCETELKMMLANGLTSVRILAGQPAYLEAGSNIKEGKWIGPDLSIASPQRVGSWPWPPAFKNYEIVDTKENATNAVKRFKQESYDEIKITFMVRRAVYDEIINTAKQERIKVTGHVARLVKLPGALETGQQIEHMDEFVDVLLSDTSYNHGQSVSDINNWRKQAWVTVPFLDEKKIQALVKMVKDAGIYVSPTNFFFISTFGDGVTEEQAKQNPGYAYIPAAIKKERWENWKYYNDNSPPAGSGKKYVQLRKKMAYELWKAGVPLMAGTDPPNFSWYRAFLFTMNLKCL